MAYSLVSGKKPQVGTSKKSRRLEMASFAKVVQAYIGTPVGARDHSRWKSAGLNSEQFSLIFDVKIEGFPDTVRIDASEHFDSYSNDASSLLCQNRLRAHCEFDKEVLVEKNEKTGKWELCSTQVEYAQFVMSGESNPSRNFPIVEKSPVSEQVYRTKTPHRGPRI